MHLYRDLLNFTSDFFFHSSIWSQQKSKRLFEMDVDCLFAEWQRFLPSVQVKSAISRTSSVTLSTPSPPHCISQEKIFSLIPKSTMLHPFSTSLWAFSHLKKFSFLKAYFLLTFLFSCFIYLLIDWLTSCSNLQFKLFFITPFTLSFFLSYQGKIYLTRRERERERERVCVCVSVSVCVYVCVYVCV